MFERWSSRPVSPGPDVVMLPRFPFVDTTVWMEQA